MLDLGTPRTERVRSISAHESGPGVCMTYLTTASNPQTLVNSGEDAVLASQAGKVGLEAEQAISYELRDQRIFVSSMLRCTMSVCLEPY